MSSKAFSPNGSSAALGVSAVSSAAALPAALDSFQMKVYNGAPTVVFIRFGTSGVTATLTDQFISPGGTEILSIPPTATHIAAIVASGTGTLYFQRGNGA